MAKKPAVKTKITSINRHRELVRFKLKNEKIVAVDRELKRIYQVRN